jgi:hypothetical protein
MGAVGSVDQHTHHTVKTFGQIKTLRLGAIAIDHPLAGEHPKRRPVGLRVRVNKSKYRIPLSRVHKKTIIVSGPY